MQKYKVKVTRNKRSLNGSGFDFFMLSAIGKFICALKQFVLAQKIELLSLKFVV